MAPALTNADPKCGIDTSRMAATKASASHVNTASWEPQSDQMIDSIETGAARLYREQPGTMLPFEQNLHRAGHGGQGGLIRINWQRPVVFLHRWIGVVLGALFAVWFAS